MQLTKTQTTVRIMIGLFFLLAGIDHLTFQRTEFLALVPNWVPMNPDIIVIISGWIEILLGLALILLTHQKTKIGWCVAFFLVAVFPGNIAQLVNHKDAFHLNTDLLRWLRLPFQPILIMLVLWSTGAWENYREKSVGFLKK